MSSDQNLIKVVAWHREQISAGGAAVSVRISPAGHSENGQAVLSEAARLSEAFCQAGLAREAIQPPTCEADGTARLRFFADQPAVLPLLLAQLAAFKQASLESLEWQYADQPAREQAVRQAKLKVADNAAKVASALAVRLQGLHSLEESLNETYQPDRRSGLPDTRVIEARVDASYRISKFSQARVDLRMLLKTRDLPFLLKKGLATQWFQLRYRAAEVFAAPKKTPPELARPRRALVAGHFSIPGGGGTFGDIEVKDKVCEWLNQAGIEYDVAANREDGVDGLDLTRLDESAYGLFIFVCGPWYPRRKIPAMLLRRFGHCLKIGVNLTVFEPGGNGFDYLLARDNLSEQHADLAFGLRARPLPVVGVLLVGRQKVYGVRQRHDFVRQVIEEFIETGEAAPLYLDTNASRNMGGIKTYDQFESIIRKLDVLLTNRLHGLVLSRKNNVPVIAIDAVAGGGKVSAQANALGWPVLIPAEELSVERIRAALRECLPGQPAAVGFDGMEKARASLEKSRAQFLEILGKFS